MKIKIKLAALSTVLALMLSIISPSSIYAQSNDVDTILHNHGVPYEIINIMPEEQKLELVNAEEFTYVGEITIQKDMESEIDTYATISSSDLSLTGYGFMYTSGGKKLAQISAYYDWLNSPFWHLTDQIGMTWSSTYYESIPGEHWINVQRTDLNGSNLTTQTSYDARDLGDDSVIFDLDMNSNYNNFGVATIKLQLKAGKSEPTSSIFYFKYAHNSIAPTIGLGISASGLGISVSTSANISSLTSSRTFKRE